MAASSAGSQGSALLRGRGRSGEISGRHAETLAEAAALIRATVRGVALRDADVSKPAMPTGGEETVAQWGGPSTSW